MLFNSLQFMIFFPVVLLVYYVIPKRVRYIWLLLASYYFYMGWSAPYALLILGSTIITYIGSMVIAATNNGDASDKCSSFSPKLVKQLTLILTLISNLAILSYFKYANFFLDLLPFTNKHVNVLLPVGISFYTFQALSYTIDVYRGDIKPERNFFRYALFVSFFPQLVAGPIERTGHLLPQIQAIEKKEHIDWQLAYKGVIYMIWGYFLKMVLADRMSIIADTVYDSYYLYGTVELIFATFIFALQIYCDFASYYYIAKGAAAILGIELMENFDAPYLSRSIKELWRRWHISLSTWFRDYVYIPLGGSRKGIVRKHINTMITFLVSGLWHGASLHYVIWGGLEGAYQVIGEMLMPIRTKVIKLLHIDTTKYTYSFTQLIVTFGLHLFALVFFRANNCYEAVDIIGRLFTTKNWWVLFNGGLYELGLARFEMSVMYVGILVLLVVDIFKYHKKEDIVTLVSKQSYVYQILFVVGMIFVIVVYGMYGLTYDPKSFIYFQF